MKKAIAIAIALFVFAATFLLAEWPEIRLFDFHGWNVFGIVLGYFVGYFLALGYLGRLMNWWRGYWRAMK
jgi:O-antigen/teichoic acid export membrane protein